MGPETTKNGPSKEVNDVNQKFQCRDRYLQIFV